MLETRSSHACANQFQGYGITTKRLIRVWFSCHTRHVGDKCIIYSDTDSLSFCLVIAETLESAAWRRGKVQSNEISLVITSLQKQLDQGIDKPMKALIDLDTVTRRETIPSFSGMEKLISVQLLQCSEIYFQDMARIGEEQAWLIRYLFHDRKCSKKCATNTYQKKFASKRTFVIEVSESVTCDVK